MVLTLLLASSTVFLVTAIAGSMVVGLLYVLTSPEPDTTDETRSTRTERRANRRK